MATESAASRPTSRCRYFGEQAADDTTAIRQHLRRVATSFGTGDFASPFEVHDQEVPGTRLMAQKRAAIRYAYRPLPRGGEIRIRTSDPEAIRAIHEFLAFQRQEHHAAGRTRP